MKTLLKLLITSTLLLAGTMLFAQANTDMASARPEKMLKSIGLTDSQITQVLDIHAKTEALLRTQRAQMKVNRAQIELAMTSSNPDMAAVNSLVDKNTQLQGEMTKKFLATAAQIHQIVGDEAFYKLKAWFLANHKRDAWGCGRGKMRPAMESWLN